MPIIEQDYTIQAGQVVIGQGEPGVGLFILQSGTLEIYKDEILLSIMMHPGTIFGEMCDILSRPRSCTVRAKTPSKVTHVQADSIDELVEQRPELATKIIRTLAGRLERTTQKLVDTARDNTLWSSAG
ncbi:MAG: cyclic nucleotide-binding domain-containing protein [Verrucomicrobia bacterium]|nr:cyclic nucleotide-binding domain-containing protein [Verrucomicrobiota bacterium]